MWGREGGGSGGDYKFENKKCREKLKRIGDVQNKI